MWFTHNKDYKLMCFKNLPFTKYMEVDKPVVRGGIELVRLSQSWFLCDITLTLGVTAYTRISPIRETDRFLKPLEFLEKCSGIAFEFLPDA